MLLYRKMANGTFLYFCIGADKDFLGKISLADMAMYTGRQRWAVKQGLMQILWYY